jgi:hypothetical protein
MLVVKRKRKRKLLLGYVGQNEVGIGNSIFEIFVAEVEDWNGNLNEIVWTFSKGRNLEFGEGFRSNEFKLKVWNISKWNFKFWFNDVNQGI